DKQILTILEENSLLAWERLYDKNASAMYGLIFSLVNDKVIAEKIFIAGFIHLKENTILSTTNIRFVQGF
ncbi:MAG: hypothetical protein ABIS01_03685, partial [Ferruginibacter sp.]